MTLYCPSYLHNVERGAAGWPLFIAEDREFQDWLVSKCSLILTRRGPLSTRGIYHELKRSLETPEDHEQYKKFGAYWDGIDACVDRALRGIASQVWQLNAESGR